MVYPVELATGAAALIAGYVLHTGYLISDGFGRRTGAVGAGVATEGRGRRRVVVRQAAGAGLFVLGLVLLLDGLGL